MKKKESQRTKVENELKSKGFITSWGAIQKFRITRLSAIIFTLRDEGWDIESIPEKNEETHWAKYVWKNYNPQTKLF